MNEVITFLINNGANKEDINKILNIFLNIKCEDDSILTCLEYLYDLFYFAGLNGNQIAILLGNSRVIFDAYYGNFKDINRYFNANNCLVNNLYLGKLAYVYKNTNYIDDIFKLKSYFYGLSNYKRIFIRSFVYDRNQKVNLSKSRKITSGESYTYRHGELFVYAVKELFEHYVASDNDLEIEINKKIQAQPGYDNVTVEKIISNGAIKFLMDFYKYRNNKNKGAK